MIGDIDLKKWCVICVQSNWRSSSYWQLVTTEAMTITVNRVTVSIPHGDWNQLHIHVPPGDPVVLVDAFEQIRPERLHAVYLDSSTVGVWAQFEWFGLRVCGKHLWKAQELWERGGNRNWNQR